jgi:hypothetical protein
VIVRRVPADHFGHERLSGNQAVAVSMRATVPGRIKPMDFYYVWRKKLCR